jgi:hypothetical protein
MVVRRHNGRRWQSPSLLLLMQPLIQVNRGSNFA